MLASGLEAKAPVVRGRALEEYEGLRASRHVSKPVANKGRTHPVALTGSHDGDRLSTRTSTSRRGASSSDRVKRM